MLCCEAVLGLAVLAAVVGEPKQETVVRFVQNGAPVELSPEEQSKIADEVRTLMTGCGLNSVRNPTILAPGDAAAAWEVVRKGSHLYVRWAEPAASQHGAGSFQEAVVGFEDPGFIGPELTRNLDAVVVHAKCDGYRCLALMCGTALRAHLLPGQFRACEAYDRIARR